MAAAVVSRATVMPSARRRARHGPTPDSAARFTEPCLNMWGINYYLVESDADVGRISIAFEEALRESRPVAVLMGAEYAPG